MALLTDIETKEARTRDPSLKSLAPLAVDVHAKPGRKEGSRLPVANLACGFAGRAWRVVRRRTRLCSRTRTRSWGWSGAKRTARGDARARPTFRTPRRSAIRISALCPGLLRMASAPGEYPGRASAMVRLAATGAPIARGAPQDGRGCVYLEYERKKEKSFVSRDREAPRGQRLGPAIDAPKAAR
jgi:hypothetical protein